MDNIEVPARRMASRRRLLSEVGLLAIGAIVLTSANARAAPAPVVKKSQKAVDYQGHAKGGHSCNTCKAFQGPNKCKTVEGFVVPAGWCNLYEHS